MDPEPRLAGQQQQALPELGPVRPAPSGFVGGVSPAPSISTMSPPPAACDMPALNMMSSPPCPPPLRFCGKKKLPPATTGKQYCGGKKCYGKKGRVPLEGSSFKDGEDSSDYTSSEGEDMSDDDLSDVPLVAANNRKVSPSSSSRPSVCTVLGGPDRSAQQLSVLQKKKQQVPAPKTIVAAEVIRKQYQKGFGTKKTTKAAVAATATAAPLAQSKPKPPKPSPPATVSEAKKTATLPPKKRIPAPHLRRLRVVDSKKVAEKKKREREQEKDKDKDPKEGDAAAPSPSKRRKGGVPESSAVLDADTKSLDMHPVLTFLRDNTPVKPCGRCAECRKPACGTCANCKNNEHLTERSRDRKRCTAHGCNKLTVEELQRYRDAHAATDSIADIQGAIRDMRDRFIIAQSKDTPADEVKALENEQQGLMDRLAAYNERAKRDEPMPEGYECLLLSIQTLETERDRVARLVERRTSRDSPAVMRTRRQLRNFYGILVCTIAKMFAVDLVSRSNVDKLIEIAEEYEAFVQGIQIA